MTDEEKMARRRESRLQWRLRNPDKDREAKRRWKERNHDRDAAYRRENSARENARAKRWAEANPERARANKRRHITQKLASMNEAECHAYHAYRNARRRMSMQLGIHPSALPIGLLRAKAAQILIKRTIRAAAFKEGAREGDNRD